MPVISGCCRISASSCPVLRLNERAGPDSGWRITYSDQSGEKAEDFDFAVVCIGLYSETPNIPLFDGRDQFKGEVIYVSALNLLTN